MGHMHRIAAAAAAMSVVVATSPPATAAADSCRQRYDNVLAEWLNAGIHVTPRSGSLVEANGGHTYLAAEASHMHRMLNEARVLCGDGKEQDSIRLLDGIHTWLIKGRWGG